MRKLRISQSSYCDTEVTPMNLLIFCFSAKCCCLLEAASAFLPHSTSFPAQPSLPPTMTMTHLFTCCPPPPPQTLRSTERPCLALSLQGLLEWAPAARWLVSLLLLVIVTLTGVIISVRANEWCGNPSCHLASLQAEKPRAAVSRAALSAD